MYTEESDKIAVVGKSFTSITFYVQAVFYKYSLPRIYRKLRTPKVQFLRKGENIPFSKVSLPLNFCLEKYDSKYDKAPAAHPHRENLRYLRGGNWKTTIYIVV
jgi:hypothetical protein